MALAGPSSSVSPLNLTIDEVYEGIAAAFSKIEGAALRLVYEWEAETVLPAARKGILGPRRTGIRAAWVKIISDRSRRFYAHVVHEDLQANGEYERIIDEGAWDGELGTQLVGRRDGFITTEMLGPYWFDRYFWHIFYPFKPREKAAAKGDPKDLMWLPDAFRKASYRIVGVEELGGIACVHVSLPGVDDLWIDVAHGYAVRRREMTFGPGRPLRMRWRNMEFKHVGEGLWLPTLCVTEQFGPLEEPENYNKVVLRFIMRVSEIATVRKFPSGTFRVSFPAGTIVYDERTGRRYRVTRPGEDLFDDSIARAENLYLLRGQLWGLPRWVIYVTVIFAALTAFFAIAVALRVRRSAEER